MLIITPGEPAGVGPELVVQLAQRPRNLGWVVAADPDLLRQRAAALSLPLNLDDNVDQPSCQAGALTVWPHALGAPAQPGVLNPDNADYVIATLSSAVQWAQAQPGRALVTAPVQKSVLDRPEAPFSGHTEFLRDRCGVEDVVMLLVAGSLRVALATTHLPLRDVADAISAPLLKRRLQILREGLALRVGLADPRLLVAGLNPHAGESGHLGREEIDVITPVCEQLRTEGWRLEGPLPADTLFTPQRLANADAVLAMYHDQGLPVLKYAGFGEAVNVTLGLPFLRTSVDHGTALDIAGSGRADSGSLAAAIALASASVSGAAAGAPGAGA